jgi:hypothetical protein
VVKSDSAAAYVLVVQTLVVTKIFPDAPCKIVYSLQGHTHTCMHAHTHAGWSAAGLARN